MAVIKVSPMKCFIFMAVVLFVLTQFLVLHLQEGTVESPKDVTETKKKEEREQKERREKFHEVMERKKNNLRRSSIDVKKHWHGGHKVAPNVSVPDHSESDEDSLSFFPRAWEGAEMMNLPSPSLDQTELVMNSVIERTSDSWQLHLTTFFLSAAMVVPQENRLNKAERIDPNYIGVWRQIVSSLNQVSYLENGRRSPRVPYYCRIYNSKNSHSYRVPGEFVPNRQTTDPNTNRRVDVLRCPIKNSKLAYQSFGSSSSTQHLFVEILRKTSTVARFSVPWSTRRTGYLLSPVATNNTMSSLAEYQTQVEIASRSTKLNSWSGYDSSSNGDKKPSGRNEFHLCVVGMSPPQMSSDLLVQMVEFIEYHISMGVAHMYFSVHFAENSYSMKKILRVLQWYIQSGYVTITTTAGDGINMIDSFAGIKWNALTTDTFVINSCLYLAKGMADYVGIWDLNEFFVPKAPHVGILDVLRAVSSPTEDSLYPALVHATKAEDWRGGRGWADGDGHPFCYLNFNVANSYFKSSSGMSRFTNLDMSTVFDFDNAFIKNGQTKSVLPTKIIFQAGILSPGCCRLPSPWANCDPELLQNDTDDKDMYIGCISNDPSQSWVSRQYDKQFQKHHEYDDVVLPADGKTIRAAAEGYLLRLNPFKMDAASKRNDGIIHEGAFYEHLRNVEKNIRNRLSSSSSSFDVHKESMDISIDFSAKKKILDEWIVYTEAIVPASIEADPTEALPADTGEADRVRYSSRNGYHNFTETFTKPDVLSEPAGRTLPAFASDFSDIAVGAVIERKHGSWDLHLTTFLLNHNFFWQPIEGYGMMRIAPENKEKWQKIASKFNDTVYSQENGKRVIMDVFSNTTGERTMIEEKRYKCRLRNSNKATAEVYTVEGEFMPNKLTPDKNANNRLDILRCRIRHPRKCYRSLSNSSHHLEVAIINPNGDEIFNFDVPWKSRRVGYLLSTPEVAASFQPWKAFDRNSDDLPGVRGGDMLYMSVPGIESTVSQHTLPMYLEFLQHHFLIGVEHVFMAGTYAWNGAMMSNFLAATKSFIDDGLLTVSSQAGDNFDLLYSFLGGSLDRDTVKIFHVNMYLYLTKGMVDYLALWDIDEYFIPKLPHHTIQDVIRAAESAVPLQPFPLDADPFVLQKQHKPGPGWADGDGHPFCYLMLSSECIFSSLGYPEVYDQMKPWAGQKYPHASEPLRAGLSFKKSIIPTKRIFQAGLHMHGACHLGRDWSVVADSPCSNYSEFCNVNFRREQLGWTNRRVTEEGETIDFSLHHKFDAFVSDKDAKKIEKSDGLIYHFQFHRSYLSASDSVLTNSSKNEYASRFFPRVLQELKRRRLNALVALPDNINEEKDPLPDEYWEDLWRATEKYILSEGGDARLAELPATPVTSPVHATHPSALPVITRDHSDVILGSLIERQHDSFDLYLTTFFLCKEQLANYTKNIMNPYVRPDTLGTWMRTIRKARSMKYTVQGKRDDGYTYYCRISNYLGHAFYTVRGDFIPNEMTPDGNANKRFDVLRCPIFKPYNAYKNLARTSATLRAEIFRGNFSLVNFSIAWDRRRTGFLLSSPPETSKLDVWKGFQSNASTLPGAKDGPDHGGDDLHMCVPGLESPMSKVNLAMYVENIQHHLNLGVKHIHLAVTYTWGSQNMDLFLETFGHYIDDGLVSVVSAAGDEDLVYGLLGMSMHRDNVKIFFVNMCLYLTKGMVDYLAIWDIDEYFIPMLPHHTIMDVVHAQEAPEDMQPLNETESDPWQLAQTWKGGPGWADGDGHAFCYLQMHSEVLCRPKESKAKADGTTPWVGMRFTRAPEPKTGLAFKKPILPTRVIFQAGLHMAGGCKLSYPWSGCPKDMPSDQFCLSTKFAHRYGYSIKREPSYNATDFSFEQRFDGLIMDKDTRAIDETTQAVLYHVQLHRHFFTSVSPENSTNEYIKRFYPSVVQSLRQRGMELDIIIPNKIRSRGVEVDAALGWQDFDDFYSNITARRHRWH